MKAAAGATQQAGDERALRRLKPSTVQIDKVSCAYNMTAKFGSAALMLVIDLVVGH